jgi:fatty acid desaturase
LKPDRPLGCGTARAEAGPHDLNGLLVCTLALLHAIALLVLPLLLQPGPVTALALLAIAATTMTLWSLIHEAIHGLLFRDRRLNDAAGRALCILFGAPLRALRAGHLLHHRFSRTVRERTEVYDATRTSCGRAAAGYYARLLGGMYWLEVLGGLAAWLPARTLAALDRRLQSDAGVLGMLAHTLRQPAALREMRLDALASLAVMVTAFALYGNAWHLLAGFLAVRGFAVSFSDNAYHYATMLDAPRAAKNLRAPRWAEYVLLSFTLHGTHHRHPALPWRALRKNWEAEGARYDEGYFEALMRQLAGPIEVNRLPHAAPDCLQSADQPLRSSSPSHWRR